MIEQIGPLLWPLLCLSLLAVMFIVERLVYFLRLARLEDMPELHAMAAELEQNKTLSKDVRDELMSLRLLQCHDKLEFGIQFLRFIAVVSPMLGLLGTVIGMISAFKTIAATTGPVEPAMIADGLWSAMLTTACGLVIALPCLLAAFVFARMAEKRLNAMKYRLNEASLALEGATLA